MTPIDWGCPDRVARWIVGLFVDAYSEASFPDVVGAYLEWDRVFLDRSLRLGFDAHAVRRYLYLNGLVLMCLACKGRPDRDMIFRRLLDAWDVVKGRIHGR